MLFASNEKGQGLVEYALIIVLIAIVVVAAVGLFGTTLNSNFELIESRLDEVTP